MGNRYWVRRDNFTRTTGQDDLTLISPSARRIRVLEFIYTGVGSLSSPTSGLVSRSTAGTTPGGAIVPSKAEHSEQPAAAFTTATTWAAQPTPETNGITAGWNNLGGAFPWKSTQKSVALEARNGETISFRPGAGATLQATNLAVLVEED